MGVACAVVGGVAEMGWAARTARMQRDRGDGGSQTIAGEQAGLLKGRATQTLGCDLRAPLESAPFIMAKFIWPFWEGAALLMKKHRQLRLHCFTRHECHRREHKHLSFIIYHFGP